MNFKKILSLLLAFTMLFSLAACSSSSSSDDVADDETALTEITFVLDWTPNTNHTGLYVAIANGYFEDAGINVTVVQPPEDGAEMMVASGQAEFGVSFQDSMLPAILDAELPITAVAAMLAHNTSGIVSLAGNGMDTPSGLEGHTYATWDMEIEKAMMQSVVETDGGDWSQVTLIPSTVTDEVSALQTGSVDAIWIFYGWAGIACEVAGLEIDYFDFADIDPVFDYYTPVIIANDDFLAENPETATAFLSALALGYEFCVENPEEAADILIEACPELESSRDLVVASQIYLADEYIADSDYWGQFDADRWNAFYAWLSDNGLSSSEVPADFGFTNEYLN